MDYSIGYNLAQFSHFIFIKECESLIEVLENISPCIQPRCDIDDREESVSRKIRDAEKEWIPIIVVVGEKEIENNKFIPRFRSDEIGESNRDYSIKELHDLLTKKIEEYPQEKIPLPIYLSKRPRFKG